MGTEAIPATAWEQAVFVVLFVVFVIAMLSWFTKQNDKWQQFMATRDDKWQEFSREQRRENNACMADVNKGLSDLTQVTQGLVNEVREMRQDSQRFYEGFGDHDAQAKEILTIVAKKPATRTRKPKVSEDGD